VLPSNFVGGRRFMDQLYFDGMAICGHVGFPYLFVTYLQPEMARDISNIKDDKVKSFRPARYYCKSI